MKKSVNYTIRINEVDAEYIEQAREKGFPLSAILKKGAEVINAS